jgi:hypothetical protein
VITVRRALYEFLAADTTLASLSPGGIWYMEARRPDIDEPVPTPLTIFQKTSGQVRHYTLNKDDHPTDDELWLVKGVGTSSEAEAIDERVKEILQDAPLNITGRTLLLLVRDSAMPPYMEDTDGEHYRHIGSVYRLESVPQS